MDRHWLLTWTTYGSWLPGDVRGFVSQLRTPDGEPYVLNVPGTEYEADIGGLQAAMRGALRGQEVRLVGEQAEVLYEQFVETATHRQWRLEAAAVMCTHIHLVVGVEGDPAPATILQSFKSYASRRLNGKWGKPVSETWWTESGSTRKLRDENAVLAAIEYVRFQQKPLGIWIRGEKVDSPGERGQ